MIRQKHIDVLKIPDNTGYWLVRADGGKYYDDFLKSNFIAISDNEIKLSEIEKYDEYSIAGITLDHFKELYNHVHPEWNNQQIAHAASRTYKFYSNIKKGDIVVVPSRRSSHLLLGMVSSDVY